MKKNLALEGLRGLACLAVVSAHFLYIAFPYLARVRDSNQSAYVPTWPWETWLSSAPLNLLYNGDFAVLIFFVLSGYVLTNNFWRTGSRLGLVEGAIKRYPRLMIPSAASIAIAFVLLKAGLIDTSNVPDQHMSGFILDNYRQPASIAAAAYAAFLGVPFLGDLPSLAWNGPLWTMRIELWGSLGLFAVFFLFPKRRPLAILLYAAVSVWIGMTLYFLPFILGAAIHFIVPWVRRHPTVSLCLFCVGAFFGCVSYTGEFDTIRALLPAIYDPLRHKMDTIRIWYVLGAAFMIAGVVGNGSIAAVLGSNICAFVGKISFSMYLLHWPLIFSYSLWCIRALRSAGLGYLGAAWISFGTTIAILIAASALFEILVESKATRLAGALAGKLVGKAPRVPIPA
jgi:peptidoglycan/LPS O-acetylase OafA/YrhL